MNLKLIKKYEKNEKYFFILFIIATFIFYLSWMLILPFRQGPDEFMRYQIAWFILNNGYLPHGGDPLIRNPIWGISYGFTPITSYIISALFMKITNLFTSDGVAMLRAARLVSVICNTATVGVCIGIGQKLFKRKPHVKWLFILLVSMLPQFVFISSYVNIDSFAMLCTSVIIYFWIEGLKTGWNYKSCIGLSIALSACLLSYYNAYGFVLCSILIFFTTIFLKKPSGSEVKLEVIKKTLLIMSIVFLLSGWWFIRNAALYNGDFLGLSTSNYYAEMYADDQHKPSSLDTPINEGQSLWFMLKSRLWLLLMARSFIGCFGNSSIPLFLWMYVFYGLVLLLGIVGCFMGIKKFFPGFKNIELKNISIFNMIMIFAMIIPLFINIYYSYTSDFQPQGRYSMPALIPLMYFISNGVWIFLKRFIKNNKAINAIVIGMCVVIILIAVTCLTNIIIPTYY